MIETKKERIEELEKRFEVGAIYTLKDTIYDNEEELYEGTPVMIHEIQDNRLVVADYRGVFHTIRASVVSGKKKEKLTSWQNFLLRHQYFLTGSFSRLAAFAVCVGLIGTLIGIFIPVFGFNFAEWIGDCTLVVSLVLLLLGVLVFLFAGEASVANAKELASLLKAKENA